MCVCQGSAETAAAAEGGREMGRGVEVSGEKNTAVWVQDANTNESAVVVYVCVWVLGVYEASEGKEGVSPETETIAAATTPWYTHTYVHTISISV